MPWREVSKMEERLMFCTRARLRLESFTALCREYNIVPKTGYKWLARYEKDGLAGLEDGSRRPKRSSKETAEDVITELIRIKTKRMAWGPKKVQRVYGMSKPGLPLPSLSTVNRILEKSGLVRKRRKRRGGRDERIQNRKPPENPNDLWTVDFKGWWYTPKRERCEPLTVRDEFSKYILGIRVLAKADTSGVKFEFERLFREYGLPRVIRSDNGPPFASGRSKLGLTKLAVWWMSLGIERHRIDPGSPQQNGAHERMHRDMKNELQGLIHGDLVMHQAMFDTWRRDFNEERPHEALNMQTPASIYVRSKRRYEEFDCFGYPKGFLSRQVNDRGRINLMARLVPIGNAFCGYNVGLCPQSTGGWEVWFGTVLIGWIDKKDFIFSSVLNQEHEEQKALPMS